ncbi:MAG: SDR family oxidoreductase, partial [Planctomycetales bacterium]|nr:SDR family oxidoreductase [Planctomycetales bacterium]
AGMDGMTRALARELGPRGIRVNSLAPGYLDTEMSHGLDDQQRQQIIRRTPLGRLGTVDDVAPWIEFLLTDASRFVTGQVITIDGGATV